MFQSDCVLYMFIKMHDIYIFVFFMENEIFTNFILLGSYGDVYSKIHSQLVQVLQKVDFERKLLHMMQITKWRRRPYQI